MRNVTVEFGERELVVSRDEALKWYASGLAEWLPRRNRMRFTARRDPKPVLVGMSSVFGKAIAEASNESWAQTFIRNQFPLRPKREMNTTK
jgi:hypothetical protein